SERGSSSQISPSGPAPGMATITQLAASQPKASVHRLALPTRRVEARGEKRVRSGREEFLLSSLGKMAEPPVVHGPERIAPAGRPAPTAELPGHGVGHVQIDAQAAVARRVADPDE